MKLVGKIRLKIDRSFKTRGLKAEVDAWRNIKDRCYRKTHKQYKNYGGRGIKMCRRWRDSFENFIKDIGKRPPNPTGLRKDEWQIDRIDNNKGYFPGNIKWSTRKEQMNNRSIATGKIYEAYGERHTLKEWGEKLGLSRECLYARIRSSKHSLEEVLVPGKIKYIRETDILLTFKGETKTIREWSQITGIKPYLIRSRFRSGKTPEECLKNSHLQTNQILGKKRNIKN